MRTGLRKFALLIIGIFVAGLPAAAQRKPSARQPSLAITHVTLIDGTGAPPQSDMTVVVRGDRIVQIVKSARKSGNVSRETFQRFGAVFHRWSPAENVSRETFLVDGKGKYLIPGLLDSHVHLDEWFQYSLAVFAANGVTAVRDMGGEFSKLQAWRQRIAEGSLVGPRIKTAGPILESERFLQILPKVDELLNVKLAARVLPSRIGVSTPEQARQAVDRLAEMGVDFVKFRTLASREVFLAIAEESKRRGLAFTGHDSEVVNLAEASNAGQRSIEHLPLLSLRKASDAARAATFRTFAANGTWVDPTLVASVGYRGVPDEQTLAVMADKDNAIDPRRKYLTPEVLEFWRIQILAKKIEEPLDWPKLLQQGFSDLRTMHAAGVKMVAGTDAGAPNVYPGFSLHEELEMLVKKGGLTPMEAIESATLEPARMMGLEKDLGTIAPGKLADLVLLNADPLQDIGNTKRIVAVIMGGRLLNRESLDKMLEDAAAGRAAESGR
jgi:imidazolonepropionase-like amidohydrolase